MLQNYPCYIKEALQMLFGIGWLILTVMVIVWVCVALLAWDNFGGSFGVTLGALAGGLFALVAFMLLSLVALCFQGTESRSVPIEPTKLVAMNNGTSTSISGSFFLGCGGFSSESTTKYTYMAQLPNGDFELRVLNADQAEHVYVREQSSTPSLEGTKEQTRYIAKSWVPGWLWAGIASPMNGRDWSDDVSSKPSYRFIVPKGTVKYGFDVSTAK